MTNSLNNAKTRKNVLRSLALAAVVALGAALPFAGSATAQDVRHDRGWHGETWRHREVRPFYPAFAPVPVYPAPVYATPYYGAPVYAPPVVGASIGLPGVGLFFNIR
jgi:hypothetical protein